MLTEGEPVVGEEEDHGPVQVTVRGQLADDALHGIVDAEEGLRLATAILDEARSPPGVDRPELPHPCGFVGEVALVEARGRREWRTREGAHMPGRRRPRRMRRARREVEEEGPLGRGRPEEIHGTVGEQVGGVRGGRVARLHRHGLVDEPEVRVRRVGGRIAFDDPAVPPGRDERPAVERVQVEVLPDQTGEVAGLVQPCGDRLRVVEALTVIVRRDVRVPAELARKDRRARGTAQRRLDERLREPQPVAVAVADLRLQPR